MAATGRAGSTTRIVANAATEPSGKKVLLHHRLRENVAVRERLPTNSLSIILLILDVYMFAPKARLYAFKAFRTAS